jgi:DNA ligase-1
MRDPWKVITALEADNSRLAKEVIIAEQAATGNTEFFAGARLALDAMITFGVKKVPESKLDGPGLDWVHFDTAVHKLARREVTGHAALDLIDGLMSLATQEQWNSWYRRILIKDLRCGTSETTINKMVTKTHAPYSIPVFSCQLAHDSANHESKVIGKKLIEVKLDGVRVITICYPDGRVDQYSRNGKELVNFPHVKDQLSKVAHGFNEPMVLDGEIMSGSFQDLMKQIHRKSETPAADAVLNLFDYVTLADFETGASTAKQEHRSRMLVEWFDTVQTQLPNVTVVGQELVDLDTDTGQARYVEINKQAIAGGYEGIMLKDPAAGYECKRSVAWLKLKPFIEVSLNVTAIEEGTGRNVGRLGALVCSGSDDGKSITVNVGSGFSDAARDQFYRVRGSIIDQVVEVRADAITQNQDGTYSLRFPRFLRFRGFAAGEKI